MAILIALLWPYAVVTVHSGEIGVKYSPLFGGTVMDRTYSEGLHLLFPWDTIISYNTRLQHEDINIPVLSRGGLSVDMKVSVYFTPIVERVAELHKDIGPDYKEMLIRPIVSSSIRNTVGSYWPEDLYTTAPLKLQDELMVQAVEQMARKPVIIDSIVVRGMSLPEQVNQAIDLKFSAEQEYLRYKYVLLKAGEQMKENYLRAESIRMFQDIVNGGMTDAYLRWAGIEATKELAASNNSKFVIMGGRDGLPVILNMDSDGKGGAPAKKERAPSGETISSHDSAKRLPRDSSGMPDWQALKSRFETLQNSIQKITPRGRNSEVGAGRETNQPTQGAQ
ncbi:MAG TPA: prohibitin family protein [Humidesulfovibrio sp.]|uniref:prohibitin family protein n=1 Tax=Humidesulfovibrio sp. TaxID=2910988 RepID=UPI002C709D78|nr:prohibitin family protein [Humidesulfovibrio sp.]HWR03459.1 prohibitin family protein [Humidesulfovibrio sp.]